MYGQSVEVAKKRKIDVVQKLFLPKVLDKDKGAKLRRRKLPVVKKALNGNFHGKEVENGSLQEGEREEVQKRFEEDGKDVEIMKVELRAL